MDSRDVRTVVGLIMASKSAFSSDLSFMDTSLRQKMIRSLDKSELATLRNILSKIAL